MPRSDARWRPADHARELADVWARDVERRVARHDRPARALRAAHGRKLRRIQVGSCRMTASASRRTRPFNPRTPARTPRQSQTSARRIASRMSSARGCTSARSGSRKRSPRASNHHLRPATLLARTRTPLAHRAGDARGFETARSSTGRSASHVDPHERLAPPTRPRKRRREARETVRPARRRISRIGRRAPTAPLL
jgi:hypothetical protein